MNVVRLNIYIGDFMQKITPFLWFDNIAEEDVNFYTSIFQNSKIDVAALEEAYNK